ncbi:hypothetical protein CCAX7_44530 [Capsulimonas corticalis]|uniref:Uncharacterized protein n=1 Tax=Capsulimonas corticalis TaxID=2219043 RepID=A0A402CX45_9BACT|nr:hypothetical protein [Capsulimonas corticalis]BDI32402.1 hypothetical protein CCAX7_44530 [Capsulimonas corticalis]
MSMLWNTGGPARQLTEKDVKICSLCGALNHMKNSDCFTCGWQGVFERDPAMIHLAWQRLYDQFERVEPRHIGMHRPAPMGDFGVVSPRRPMPAFAARISNWWRRIMAERDERAAQREAKLRAQHFPPNELGV